MKFRILDAFFIMVIAALIYVQMTEGQQHRSNHFFLKGVIGRRWLEHTADIANIDARLDAIGAPQPAVKVTAPRSMGDASYVCGKCGWKPRDDGPMNNEDTFEPLVAALRIDAHEQDHSNAQSQAVQ